MFSKSMTVKDSKRSRSNSRKRTRKQFETTHSTKETGDQITISKDEYDLIDNTAGGSCLIKSILKGFINSKSDKCADLLHQIIRNSIVNYIRHNLRTFVFINSVRITIADWIHKVLRFESVYHYCTELVKPTTYCASLETEIAAKYIFNCNIFVFRDDQDQNTKYSLCQSYCLDSNNNNVNSLQNMMSNNDPYGKTILLHYDSNHRHYQTLFKKNQRDVIETRGNDNLSSTNNTMCQLPMCTYYHPSHYPYYSPPLPQQYQAPLYIHQDENEDNNECKWNTMNAYFLICQAKYKYQQQFEIKTFSQWLTKFYKDSPSIIQTNRMLRTAKYLYEHNIKIKRSQLNFKFTKWKQLNKNTISELAKDMQSNIKGWQIPKDFKEKLLIN